MHARAAMLVVVAMLVAALAACGKAPPPNVDEAADARNATRAWLTRALTCGDRDFLRLDQTAQRQRLSHMQGVACEAPTDNTAMRCALTPPLRIGDGDIGWFVLGAAHGGIAPVILPAPPEALRNAIATGAGSVGAGTDLGDTRVECGLTDRALRPGAIAGTVLRTKDPDASVRVCAFELNDGVSTCTVTGRGARAYRIDGLAGGDYVVLALPADAPASRVGYTDCIDETDTDTPCTHELKIVAVPAGTTVGKIDPADLRTLEEAASWPQPPPAD